MEPTNEQQIIINEECSCVVIAKPGSGKTFTLSKKIRAILQNSPEYKGVIAISYTNKASNELKQRSLDGGFDKKGSFFGTIDKFFISEIIFPFGSHVFGKPLKIPEIFKSNEDEFIHKKEDARVQKLIEQGYDNLLPEYIIWIKNHFINGVIFLELIGIIALYIFDNSLACRRYLKSRYSHIIVDEYQDSGLQQHQMFLRLKKLGLVAIAVGDTDQSIFGFANKDARYLLELAKINDGSIKLFQLSKNHRCHNSIVNYSLTFLNNMTTVLPTKENRVFEKKVIGNQFHIVKWLDSFLPKIIKKFNVGNHNKIGVLVRGEPTGLIIDKNLKFNHKYFQNTPLDEDSNPWSQLFREILQVIYDKNSSIYELIEKYIDINLEKRDAKYAMQILKKLTDAVASSPFDLYIFENELIELAEVFLPNNKNEKSITILNKVLNENNYLKSYIPANEDEIQVMTIHKSKGLEFDVVFHLDLYQYVLPNTLSSNDPSQDINLHYVGITRAKEALFLIWSTERFNRKGELKRGIRSEFLESNRLITMRTNVYI